MADKRKGSNNDNWVSALHYLERFTGGKKNMNELTVKFCEDFRYYLLNASSSRTSGKPLAQNSAHSYFNKFKAALKQAYKDGYLQTDLNVQVTPIRQKETQRTFLTEEELQTLVDTPCDSKLLKRAGIFSALTGMRHSDIVNLRWRDIQHRQGGGYTVHHRQQKTDNVESLPISDEAYSLLGKMGEPDGQVFAGLTYSAHNNHLLQKWVWRAGINKEFTFHCFRHTYATIQLTKGTPITTLMELLGHKDIKQTLVYAKIVEPLKREAANKMSVRLNPEMI
jgi:integrase